MAPLPSPLAQPVSLLLAEDDDGHADLIFELLRDVGIQNPVIRFRDGQEVLDFLCSRDGAPGPVPGYRYLLLLDIRMPRVDGVQVLARMKGEERLRGLPVIMLTTTDDPREIEACYALGCNCYVTKPVEFGRFSTALQNLGLFLQIMQVPAFPGP